VGWDGERRTSTTAAARATIVGSVFSGSTYRCGKVKRRVSTRTLGVTDPAVEETETVKGVQVGRVLHRSTTEFVL
jgi:hypothetical protein